MKNINKNNEIQLRKLIRKGNYTIYTNCNYVSQSGMLRLISCYISTAKGEIINIDWYIKQLGIATQDKRGGLRITGCGMNMGFHLVYSIGRNLYPKGFIPKKHKQYYGRNGDSCEQIDKDGGYAIKQKWL